MEMGEGAMNVHGGGRQILMHGMALFLVGLVWGLYVPQTPFPRLALTAHIEFGVNGMQLMLMAILLLKLPHSVGTRSMVVLVINAWLTWVMMASEICNAYWGTNGILPIAAAQAGATGGASWQEMFVTLAHVIPGLTTIVAWALMILGFARRRAEAA